MKYRCTYCGKPHERNNPPCDNCGNSEFEKAVVPMAPEAEDEDDYTTYVWVCTECGNDHPKNTPPCDRCGAATLERREQSFDEDAVVSEMLGEDDDGTDYSADVGYLDVLDAKLLLGFAGVGVLLAVIALGFLGVVNVPGLAPAGPVPGNATTAGGISLSDAETAYVDRLNDRRADENLGEVTVDARLRDAVTDVNQQRVRVEYSDGDRQGADVRGAVSQVCGDATPSFAAYSADIGLDDSDPAVDSSEALATALLSSPNAPSSFESAENGLVGVDIHVAPDGRVYVFQIAC